MYINNELKQKGSVELMIHKPLQIIKEAQTFLSFEDGDILMTGTPSGVGQINQGDVFLGKILLNGEVLVQNEFHVY